MGELPSSPSPRSKGLYWATSEPGSMVGILSTPVQNRYLLGASSILGSVLSARDTDPVPAVIESRQKHNGTSSHGSVSQLLWHEESGAAVAESRSEGWVPSQGGCVTEPNGTWNTWAAVREQNIKMLKSVIDKVMDQDRPRLHSFPGVIVIVIICCLP